MVYTIKETESLSMKGGKPQLSTAVLEDCKTEPSSMVKEAVCVKIRKHRNNSQRRNLLVAEN